MIPRGGHIVIELSSHALLYYLSLKFSAPTSTQEGDFGIKNFFLMRLRAVLV